MITRAELRAVSRESLRRINETKSRGRGGGNSQHQVDMEVELGLVTLTKHRCRPPICMQCNRVLTARMNADEREESRSSVHGGSLLVHWQC